MRNLKARLKDKEVYNNWLHVAVVAYITICRFTQLWEG